jgi:hypothetical protein
LLPAQGKSAKQMMSLIGDYCSAKEVVIAVQESVERIQMSLSAESDEDEEQGKVLSLVGQLDVLIALYSSCKFISAPFPVHIIDCATAISRLRLRNKSATETIHPLLSDLETTIRLIPPQAVPDEARNIISTVSFTIQNILKWVRDSTNNNLGEVVRCKVRSQSSQRHFFTEHHLPDDLAELTRNNYYSMHTFCALLAGTKSV